MCVCVWVSVVHPAGRQATEQPHPNGPSTAVLARCPSVAMDCPHIVNNVGLGRESIRSVKSSGSSSISASAAVTLATTRASNVSDAVALSDVVTAAASPATVLTVASTASSAAAASSKQWKCTGNAIRSEMVTHRTTHVSTRLVVCYLYCPPRAPR